MVSDRVFEIGLVIAPMRRARSPRRRWAIKSKALRPITGAGRRSRSGGSSCRIGQSLSTSLGSSAPTTSSRLAPRRQGRDGIAPAPHYARRRIDKKKPAGPRRRMAGFLYAECYDYGNFENKVKRYRLWRRDGRAAAPIASGSFRISTLSGVFWPLF